jgi:hypothetical protein
MNLEQSTFWSEEHLAKISVSPVSEREWMESVANSRLSSLDLLAGCGVDGWYGRTSPACCRVMEGGRLECFSDSWGNAGMGSPTEFLTLNTLEYPKDGVGSSLSDILETGDVPRRYFLSATACLGILRRAEKRGKELPGQLRVALESVAGPIPLTETEEDLLTLQEPLEEDQENEDGNSMTEQGHLFL